MWQVKFRGMQETPDVTPTLRNNTNVTNSLVVFDTLWPDV